MNKIKIVDDIISDIKLDDSISLEEIPKNEFFDVITKLITSVKKFDADFADYYANLNNVKV